MGLQSPEARKGSLFVADNEWEASPWEHKQRWAVTYRGRCVDFQKPRLQLVIKEQVVATVHTSRTQDDGREGAATTCTRPSELQVPAPVTCSTHMVNAGRAHAPVQLEAVLVTDHNTLYREEGPDNDGLHTHNHTTTGLTQVIQFMHTMATSAHVHVTGSFPQLHNLFPMATAPDSPSMLAVQLQHLVFVIIHSLIGQVS
jgi:hypothetical protein